MLLTEIIAAKKRAWKLKLYSTAADYRNLECEIKGITRPNYSLLSILGKPKGKYIDLSDLRKSCKQCLK